MSKSKVFLEALDVCGCYADSSVTRRTSSASPQSHGPAVEAADGDVALRVWWKVASVACQLLEEHVMMSLLVKGGAVPSVCFDHAFARSANFACVISDESSSPTSTPARSGMSGKIARTIKESVSRHRSTDSRETTPAATQNFVEDRPVVGALFGDGCAAATAVAAASVEVQHRGAGGNLTFADWRRWVDTLRPDVAAKYLMSAMVKLCALPTAPGGNSSALTRASNFNVNSSAAGDFPPNTIKTLHALVQVAIEDKLDVLTMPPWFFMLDFSAGTSPSGSSDAGSATGSASSNAGSGSASTAATPSARGGAGGHPALSQPGATQPHTAAAVGPLVDAHGGAIYSAEVLFPSHDLSGQVDEWFSCKIFEPTTFPLEGSNGIGLSVQYLDEFIEDASTEEVAVIGSRVVARGAGASVEALRIAQELEAAQQQQVAQQQQQQPASATSRHRTRSAASAAATNAAAAQSSINGGKSSVPRPKTWKTTLWNPFAAGGVLRLTASAKSDRLTGAFAAELRFANYFVITARRLLAARDNLLADDGKRSKAAIPASARAAKAEQLLRKAQLLAFYSVTLCHMLPEKGATVRHLSAVSGAAVQLVLDCAWVAPITPDRMRLAGFALALVTPAANAAPLVYGALLTIRQQKHSETRSALWMLFRQCVLDHPSTPSRLPGWVWDVLTKLKSATTALEGTVGVARTAGSSSSTLSREGGGDGAPVSRRLAIDVKREGEHESPRRIKLGGVGSGSGGGKPATVHIPPPASATRFSAAVKKEEVNDDDHAITPLWLAAASRSHHVDPVKRSSTAAAQPDVGAESVDVAVMRLWAYLEGQKRVQLKRSLFADGDAQHVRDQLWNPQSSS